MINTSFYQNGKFLNRVDNSLMGENCPVKVKFINTFGDHHYEIDGFRDENLTNEQVVDKVRALEQFVPTSPNQETNVRVLHAWLCKRYGWTPKQIGHV